MTKKRVFKKKNAPRKRKTRQAEAVLLLRSWQKDLLNFFKKIKRRTKRWQELKEV